MEPIVVSEILIDKQRRRLIPRGGGLLTVQVRANGTLFEAVISPHFWCFSDSKEGFVMRVHKEFINLWLKYARADDLTLTDKERKQKRWLLQMLVEVPAH